MQSPQDIDLTLSTLSLSSSSSSLNEDWDHSLILSDSDVSSLDSSSPQPTSTEANLSSATPRNSIVFPANGSNDTPVRKHRHGNSSSSSRSKRSLSELLRLHAAKDTNCDFSAEEASRVADVLGQWINASSSPYEGEDDFFSSRSHDDLSIPSSAPSTRRPLKSPVDLSTGRPRGHSESANSRPCTPLSTQSVS